MSSNKIMVVDDDPEIREVLSILLSNEGYTVIAAEDGYRAVELVKVERDIDLIVMDIMMPRLSGIEACKIIREESMVPVLFLTAKSHEQDKMEAYTEGGDDYLVKPFSKTELLMKIKSLIRRYKEYVGKPEKKNDSTIGGNIVIDRKTRCAIKEGRYISLTDKEFAIMQFFVQHRGEIVGNKELYEGVWADNYLPSDGNTIMVHILNLRKKLEDNVNQPTLIQTIWGKGYRVD